MKLEPVNPEDIHLKLFPKHTARIAIISYTSGSRIDEVKINDDVLSHDWNCKAPLNMKTVCGRQKKIPTVDKQLSLSWPWVVAIYQYRSEETAARYKASGSIISTKFILTSGNSLYFEGRLLLPVELKAHVSRKTILPHVQSQGFKIYKVNF